MRGDEAAGAGGDDEGFEGGGAGGGAEGAREERGDGDEGWGGDEGLEGAGEAEEDGEGVEPGGGEADGDDAHDGDGDGAGGVGDFFGEVVAQSRQAKVQLVLTRPTMKAMGFWAQPVLLMKVAKTKVACWCVGAVEGTVMRMTAKERRET